METLISIQILLLFEFFIAKDFIKWQNLKIKNNFKGKKLRLNTPKIIMFILNFRLFILFFYATNKCCVMSLFCNWWNSISAHSSSCILIQLLWMNAVEIPVTKFYEKTILDNTIYREGDENQPQEEEEEFFHRIF